jgi:hypothetical protein
MFSTRVEMNRDQTADAHADGMFLHARGDEPERCRSHAQRSLCLHAREMNRVAFKTDELNIMFSTRVEMNRARRKQGESEEMFSTRVEMNRRRGGRGNVRCYVLHARGDEPKRRTERFPAASCSPRAWR